MEVSREYIGTKEDCFAIILEALIHDIEEETEESIEIDEIKEGFSYKKKLENRFGNEGYVQVTIAKLDVPNYYEAHFLSNHGLNILSYELTDIDEKSFNLIYKENFEGNKKTHNLNFKLMQRLYKRSSTKRVKLMLDHLETLLNN